MARSVSPSSRKEVIADVAGLSSLNLRGAWASCRRMDAWGTRHWYRSLV